MLTFIKKYKFILAAAVVITAVLVVAFISGGSAEQPKADERPGIVASEKPEETTVSGTAAASAQDLTQAASTAVSPTVQPSVSASTAAAQPTTSSSVRQQSAVNGEDQKSAPEKTDSAVSSSEQQENNTTAPAPTTKPHETTTKSVEHICTVSVSCSTLLAHRQEWSDGMEEVVPDNGEILKPVKVSFSEGENAFDVLQRVCRENNIHMEYTSTPAYHSVYIEGIGNIYEFDCGSGSGWMYRVNGWYPNYGCSLYSVCDGDTIEWVYTCDLGHDVGGEKQ